MISNSFIIRDESEVKDDTQLKTAKNLNRKLLDSAVLPPTNRRALGDLSLNKINARSTTSTHKLEINSKPSVRQSLSNRSNVEQVKNQPNNKNNNNITISKPSSAKQKAAISIYTEEANDDEDIIDVVWSFLFTVVIILALLTLCLYVYVHIIYGRRKRCGVLGG